MPALTGDGPGRSRGIRRDRGIACRGAVTEGGGDHMLRSTFTKA